MFRRSTQEQEDLAAVYAAVSAVAADPHVAEELIVRALVRGRMSRRRGARLDRRRLVADAVREAVALAPCAPLRELPLPEREAIALARYAGMDVDEIAAAVDAEPAVVMVRLRDGLRAIATQRGLPYGGAAAAPVRSSDGGPRTRLLRRDCEAAASPARVAHAS